MSSPVSSIKIRPTYLDFLPTEQREAEEQQRSQMVEYWAKHTGDNPTESTMMLMKEGSADVISNAERKEIFDKLGDIAGKTILELGAGMGRYTKLFPEKKAKSVHALDFMEASIKKNEELNGPPKNPTYTFQQADVTQVDFEQQFDVVFSNWLMMYLSDQEIESLAVNMARWCKPGGVVFFRESCAGGPSGDKPRAGFNPTNYRQAGHYTRVFDSVPGLERVTHDQLKSYVEIKKKTNQYLWKYVKPIPEEAKDESGEEQDETAAAE